jgi:hypothetical protein
VRGTTHQGGEYSRENKDTSAQLGGFHETSSDVAECGATQDIAAAPRFVGRGGGMSAVAGQRLKNGPVRRSNDRHAFEVSLGTQMFVPSKTGKNGRVPTVTI